MMCGREPIEAGWSFIPKMNAIQREYLRNARKAIRIASDVKFNTYAYNAQVAWAEAHWHNYLKSMGTKQFQTRMNHLKEFLLAKNTSGALLYVDAEVNGRG